MTLMMAWLEKAGGPCVLACIHRIGGRRPLDALVFLEQARMRVLEVDERSCQPVGVVVKALAVSEPVAHL